MAPPSRERGSGWCLLPVAILLATSCQNAPHRNASAESPLATQSTALGAQERPVPEGKSSKDQNPVMTAVLPSPPQKKKRRFVVAVLGDSITDASSGGGGFLKTLQKKCPGSQFLNYGKGGDMTNQMRLRWEKKIKGSASSKRLTTLLVYGGVNDLYSDLTASRSNERIEADLMKIYRSARESGLEVVAITVSPWGGFSKYFNERRGQNTQLLNSWILGQVATGALVAAVDSYSLLSCGRTEYLCPEYETRFHDGLHLGPRGHELLGEKLAREAFDDCL